MGLFHFLSPENQEETASMLTFRLPRHPGLGRRPGREAEKADGSQYYRQGCLSCFQTRFDTYDLLRTSTAGIEPVRGEDRGQD